MGNEKLQADPGSFQEEVGKGECPSKQLESFRAIDDHEAEVLRYFKDVYHCIQGYSGLEGNKAPFKEKARSSIKSQADERCLRFCKRKLTYHKIKTLAQDFNALRDFEKTCQAIFDEPINLEEDSNKTKALKALKDLAEQIGLGPLEYIKRDYEKPYLYYRKFKRIESTADGDSEEAYKDLLKRIHEYFADILLSRGIEDLDREALEEALSYKTEDGEYLVNPNKPYLAAPSAVKTALGGLVFSSQENHLPLEAREDLIEILVQKRNLDGSSYCNLSQVAIMAFPNETALSHLIKSSKGSQSCRSRLIHGLLRQIDRGGTHCLDFVAEEELEGKGNRSGLRIPLLHYVLSMNDPEVLFFFLDARRSDGSYIFNVNEASQLRYISSRYPSGQIRSKTILDVVTEDKWKNPETKQEEPFNPQLKRYILDFGGQHWSQCRGRRSVRQTASCRSEQSRIQAAREKIFEQNSQDTRANTAHQFEQNPQNTHVNTVHQSVGFSVNNLIERYKTKISPLEGSIFNTLKEAAESIDYTQIGSSEEKPDTKKSNVMRVLRLVKKYLDHNYMALKERVPFRKIIAAIWIAAQDTDPEVYPEELCTVFGDDGSVLALVLKNKKEAIFERLLEAGETYQGGDESQESICFVGLVHKFVESQNHAHVDVSLVMGEAQLSGAINSEVGACMSRMLRKLPDIQRNKILAGWNLSEKKPHLECVQTAQEFKQSVKKTLSDLLRQKFGTLILMKQIKVVCDRIDDYPRPSFPHRALNQLAEEIENWAKIERGVRNINLQILQAHVQAIYLREEISDDEKLLELRKRKAEFDSSHENSPLISYEDLDEEMQSAVESYKALKELSQEIQKGLDDSAKETKSAQILKKYVENCLPEELEKMSDAHEKCREAWEAFNKLKRSSDTINSLEIPEEADSARGVCIKELKAMARQDEYDTVEEMIAFQKRLTEAFEVFELKGHQISQLNEQMPLNAQLDAWIKEGNPESNSTAFNTRAQCITALKKQVYPELLEPIEKKIAALQTLDKVAGQTQKVLKQYQERAKTRSSRRDHTIENIRCAIRSLYAHLPAMEQPETIESVARNLLQTQLKIVQQDHRHYGRLWFLGSYQPASRLEKALMGLVEEQKNLPLSLQNRI